MFSIVETREKNSGAHLEDVSKGLAGFTYLRANAGSARTSI